MESFWNLEFLWGVFFVQNGGIFSQNFIGCDRMGTNVFMVLIDRNCVGQRLNSVFVVGTMLILNFLLYIF